MANQSRERAFYKKNGIPAPARNIFFYDGELVKVVQRIPTKDTIYLHHYHSGKVRVASYLHFQKTKRRAWNCYATRLIIGRSIQSWERYLARRMIPRPAYASLNNTPGPGIKAYYSEDDLYAIRDALSEIPLGAPPKHGYWQARQKILTKAELRAKIGDGRMLYVQNDDGEFVPVWSETF